jgi:hypothetical protein
MQRKLKGRIAKVAKVLAAQGIFVAVAYDERLLDVRFLFLYGILGEVYGGILICTLEMKVSC